MSHIPLGFHDLKQPLIPLNLREKRRKLLNMGLSLVEVSVRVNLIPFVEESLKLLFGLGTKFGLGICRIAQLSDIVQMGEVICSTVDASRV
jgi:hypothetical protein